MTTKDIIKDAEREFEKVANGLFLHGKQTPEQSYSLPEGQYTVQETIDHFHNTFTTLLQQLIIDIEGMKDLESEHDGHDTDSDGYCYTCMRSIGRDEIVTNNQRANHKIDDIINHLKEIMG